MTRVEHVLIDAVGHLQIVLRASTAAFQLTLVGVHSLVAPHHLRILVEDIASLLSTAKRLSELAALLSPLPADPRAPARWTARQRKLRDALIALDGRCAGASNREIAAVIYGRDWVEQDWPHAGLQDRLRRDLQRGSAFSNGLYRTLLG
ncbi:MAG: DUF2285 domain-containing protein [Hyphomicrobiaceae bacterium]